MIFIIIKVSIKVNTSSPKETPHGLQRIHRLSQSPSRRTSGFFRPFPGVPPLAIRPQTQPGPAPGTGHHTQVPRPQRL